MGLVKVWLLGSASLAGGLSIYGYAPILIPFLVVFAGLGLLTAGIVSLARWVERRRGDGH